MLKHWARADAASVPGSAQLRPVASDQYALRHATAPGATTIGVEATRLWLWYSWPNASNQRLATLGEPHRPTLSRVRCIAWFANAVTADCISTQAKAAVLLQ